MACVAASIAARAARAEPVAWIDAIDGGSGVNGWAAEPGDPAALSVYVEVFAVGDDGLTGGLVQEGWVVADLPRPDVPAADPSIVGEQHGWSFPIDPPGGGYMVRARAGAGGVPFLSPGEVRFARVAVGTLDVWLRDRGLVSGLGRGGDYESYPTALLDGSTYQMWFAGGPGDKIYAASSETSPFSGWTVAGGYTPVLSESPGTPDAGLIADPSVVLIDFPDPEVPWRYFMYYTGTADLAGTCNYVFGALSTDGLAWSKMDPSDHSFGDPGPILGPAGGCIPGDYGAGQSSVLYGSFTVGGAAYGGFLHLFTDTTAGGPCLSWSSDGGWTFPRIVSPLALGDYTWDFKFHQESASFLGALAHPGVDDGTGRLRGWVALVQSTDGVTWTPQTRVPMAWLTADPDHRCINNGGLLGDPEGRITGSWSVFYFGAGYGMQGDAWIYGRWPPEDWDLASVELGIHVAAKDPGDDDTPPVDDDTSPVPDDDSTPVADDDGTPPPDDDDDDGTASDDDTTPAADDDGTSTGDDDITGSDDDGTAAGDDDTPRSGPPGQDDTSGACAGCASTMPSAAGSPRGAAGRSPLPLAMALTARAILIRRRALPTASRT